MVNTRENKPVYFTENREKRMKYSLKSEADKFEKALSMYSHDGDIEDFLCRMRPWFERIRSGTVVSPCYDFKLNQYFFNPDLSPLADRYRNTDLMLAASRFNAAIFGWEEDLSGW